MHKPTSSSLGLAVTHLNAPVGAVLTIAQLTDALRAGSINVVSDSPTAAAIISYLFVELNPRLISLCAREAGADLHHVNMLYKEALAHSLPRVPEWENAVEYLL